MKKRFSVLILWTVCAVACVLGLSACDDTPRHEHKFSETVVAPTCTEKGYTEHKCWCRYFYRDNYTETLEHEEVVDEAVEPTCTTDGKTAGSHCSVCHTILVWQTTVKAEGHKEVIDEGIEATCTTDGITEGKHCSECNEVLVNQVTIPKGHKEVIDEGVEATCLTDGITEGKHCSVCLEVLVEQTVITAKGHNEVTDPAVEVTCTTDGFTEGSHCSECGEVFVPQTTIKAEGHKINRLNFCDTCSKNLATPGLTYTLNDDGQSYTLSGSGTVTSKDIIISSVYDDKPVTKIGSAALRGYPVLNSVLIPDTVTEIGTSAFWEQSKLTSVVMPRGLTSIGKMAFYGCESLTSLTVPSTVTNVGAHAFDYCDGLEYNTYDGACYLGDDDNPYVVLVKATDKNITSCTISDNTVIICDRAFRGCRSLESVTVPDSVTSIGKYAFDGCIGLQSISLPSSLTFVGEYAFRDCESLQFNVYDNAKYLGNSENPYVLLVCGTDADITSCNVHANTKFIYGNAFYEFGQLESVTLPDTLISIGSYAFFKCAKLANITLPDTIVSIEKYTFSGCAALTSVTFGKSVTSIGDRAFDSCDSLSDIKFGGTVDDWKAIAKYDTWDSRTCDYTVTCSNGKIYKDGSEE